jgi:hypothetical protein
MLHSVRVRSALLELHLARVAACMPPASPFGTDRIDRSSLCLTALTPAPPPLTGSAAATYRVRYAVRIAANVLRRVGTRVRKILRGIVFPAPARPSALAIYVLTPRPAGMPPPLQQAPAPAAAAAERVGAGQRLLRRLWPWHGGRATGGAVLVQAGLRCGRPACIPRSVSDVGTGTAVSGCALHCCRALRRRPLRLTARTR